MQKILFILGFTILHLASQLTSQGSLLNAGMVANSSHCTLEGLQTEIGVTATVNDAGGRASNGCQTLGHCCVQVNIGLLQRTEYLPRINIKADLQVQMRPHTIYIGIQYPPPRKLLG